MNFIDDDRCFLCGSHNPHGIKLEFIQEGEQTCLEGTVPWHFQGFQGVVHGGIVSSLLDEAMSHKKKVRREKSEVRFVEKQLSLE